VSVPRPVGVGDNNDKIEYHCHYEDFCRIGEQLYEDSLTYSPQSQEQTTMFMDEDINIVGTTSGNHEFSTNDGTVNTELSEWLKRPVRIATKQWLESDPVGGLDILYPWAALLNNAYVKNKLNNYSWFRGDLKIKIQFTASPFYYGKVRVSYQPLQSFKPSTIVIDSSLKWLIPLSQRPYIDIDAGKSDSVEMTLPFIYQANYVNLVSATQVQSLGKLDYNIYSQLQSANGATGSGITISTFAWLENVHLSGATVPYAMQSDEYGEGTISKPASWVARAASYFENIPVIGQFATATKIGASAISSIASLFGFTNVPVIDDSYPMRSEVFPKLASSEIGYPVEKLTLDPKNELSVDPRVIGLPNGEDEMAIAKIVGRESFLTKFAWTDADASDYLLFYSNVNPQMFDKSSDPNPIVQQTPLFQVTKCFTEWRGSIIFRFEIIASQYHKGKLVISFDPNGTNSTNVGNTTGTTGLVQTAIVDIGETKNVEFVVPYQQLTQFLSNRINFLNSVPFATRSAYPGTLTINNLYDNGLITVRVLNTLSAPTTTTSVDVLVHVRGGPDFEVANPVGPADSYAAAQTISFYAPQSEEIGETKTQEKDVVDMHKSSPVDHQYLVHYGENIRSIRQLLRRYQYVQGESFSGPIAGYVGKFEKYFYKPPVTPGYAGVARLTANKIVGAGTFKYNFANMTFLSWFSNAFLCYRGSTNWTFNVEYRQQIPDLKVYKRVYNNQNEGVVVSSFTSINNNNLSYNAMGDIGGSGSALTNQNTQSGLNIVCPNFSKFKFQSTDPILANTGAAGDGSNQDFFVLQGNLPVYNTESGVPYGMIYSYVAAGVDYGLYFYLNAPSFYVYTTVPTPA